MSVSPSRCRTRNARLAGKNNLLLLGVSLGKTNILESGSADIVRNVAGQYEAESLPIIGNAIATEVEAGEFEKW